MSQIDIKNEIKNWILTKNQSVKSEELLEDTKILENKLISSLQVMELIVFLGKLNGAPVSVEKIGPGTFSSISSIYEHFFVE
jgi:acyl carrier protein